MMEFADFAAQLADLGAQELQRSINEKREHITVSKSLPTDVVTEVDKSIQELIVGLIIATMPKDGIVAEEDLHVESRSGRTWFVDPLDGTSNFVRGLWPSVVSVGLEENGQLIAGAVCDPVHNELYKAQKGFGAFRNNEPLRPRDVVPCLANAYVSLSGAEVRNDQALRPRLLKTLANKADSVRDLGSSALALCYVADGRYDAHIALGVKRWDVAAGIVIALEVGCALRPIEHIANESFVLGPREIVEELSAIGDFD